MESMDVQPLVFYVNGNRVIIDHIDPRITLAVYLRDQLRLTGTKIGCNEGGCGACTVMLSDEDPVNGRIRHYSVNSCLMPVCAVFGKAVTTVEGVGSLEKLHPIQERLAVAHGSQCGFCTPGFVMAMYSLLRSNPHPKIADIDEAIQGNLCRCTGYRPILDAFYSFATDCEGNVTKVNMNTGCPMGDKCCQRMDNTNGDERTEFSNLTNFALCAPYDASQELIFPPALKMQSYSRKPFCMHSCGISWYQPITLQQLLKLKRTYPNSRIVCGNTEIGVEQKFHFNDLPVAINPKQIAELHDHYFHDTKGAYFGSALCLSQMKVALEDAVKHLPAEKCKVFVALIEMLHRFAGKHIRNVASFAGNIATASAISDLNAIWMASGASILLISEARGEREVSLDGNFFIAYRKTIIKHDEIIKGIFIPYSNTNQYFHAYKQAQRREDDIAIVTGAFFIEFEQCGIVVSDARIAFSGMAATTKLAIQTTKSMVGREWKSDLLESTLDELRKEFPLPMGSPGGMEVYRQALTQSLFFKFFFAVTNQLKNGFIRSASEYEQRLKLHDDANFTSSQIYYDVPSRQSIVDPVGRPVMHQSGKKHVTGEAIYCDDISPSGVLHLVMVLAPIACGSLDSVDWKDALRIPGVRGFIDHRDVRKGALIGGDTPIFASDTITYHCQPIGAIVADDHEIGRRAANLVKVYCTPKKPILTIEDAIAADSYLVKKPYVIHSSLVNGYDTEGLVEWTSCDSVVEGSVRIGGQEHFYMETHNVIVIPGEGDEIEVISSTQGCAMLQDDLCKCLGIPQHKIVVRVRRIGGGFGGKENASAIFALPTAIAAIKLRRPVKFMVERFDDMAISGTRHPFLAQYRVGVSKVGLLQNLQLQLFCNSGHTFDLSPGVMRRAMVHSDNVYRWPNADIYGMMCRTNIASSTAFRGFGGPQGMFAAETLMVHAAEQLGFDVNEFREKNFYKEDDCTPFGTHLRQCNVRRCWIECIEFSEYSTRLKEITEFNKSSKHIKRGIFVSPTKFGVAFGLQHLNQAGALVHVYTDGTVLVSIGGMEMGQGLFTKIIQITAACLGVPISKVHINETSTDKVPNASPTSASVGSDMNGLAVMDACSQINERLNEVKKKRPNGRWEEWIEDAYHNRISLSAAGFAIIHSQPVDFETGKGDEMFGYFVYGTACSEVEVDCLTGDSRVLRSDIVMDVGDSLNPAIDIGQIEGAFVQGLGLFTMEELKIRPDGKRLTRGPGTYKIPTADDIPRHFNVKLLKGSSNKGAIFSSKAVGEPPLFLGVSVFFAIREAIRSFRSDHGKYGYFRFDSPATPERIRLACEDSIIENISYATESSYSTRWTVEL